MDVDILIFSRNRDKELHRTIKRLAELKARVVVFHNSTQPLNFDYPGPNTEYVFCPGMSFSARIEKSQNYLKNSFSIICSDDDGIIGAELKEMWEFLRSNPIYASVGGSALGAFPYGSLITGAFAYTEMDEYENSIGNLHERIESHMFGQNETLLPRASMYRLFRKDKMQFLLESLSLCSDIQTPYIFEVVSEFMSAWIGPTKYLSNIYWIRNWKNIKVTHSTWDRSFEFSDWWESEKCRLEKSRVLDGLASLTSLDKDFIAAVLSKYSSLRKSQYKRNGKDKAIYWEPIRKIKQYSMQILFPDKVPSNLSQIIKAKYPNIEESRVRSICKVAEEMF